MGRRPDTATRARRLLALLPLLPQGETVAIAELAAAVGATPEEVAADLATLTMCGVPPFTPFDMIDLDIDGDSVTVYIEAPGIAKPLRLTIREARALAAALEAAGYDAASPLRAKLLSIASAAASNEDLERTVRAGAAPGGIADVYSAFATAADTHQKARITYHAGSTDRISERVVHPWALVNRLGVWYVVALCEEAAEERVFRLDRVRDITLLDERFQPPALVPMRVVPEPDDLPVADVRFARGAQVPDDRSWVSAVLEPQPDGTTLARVPYQSVSWLARRVAAYLGDAEVLSPPAVRDAVRALAEGTLRGLG